MDDGQGGDFKPVVGYLSDYLGLQFTVTSNVTKGTLYRFQYRAKNSIGWSKYSPVAYIQAAYRPKAPPQPVYVSSTKTTVTLSIL